MRKPFQISFDLRLKLKIRTLFGHHEDDYAMPTYIALLEWTQKGMENIEQSPKRLEQAKAAGEGR